MRPTDRKEVEKALEKKGFQKTQTDHRKFIYIPCLMHQTLQY